MRVVSLQRDWTDKTKWFWPDDDQELIRVFDWVTDLDKAIAIAERGTVIQAGGACGQWPHYLSDFFDRVVTLEPNKENFRCLLRNCANRDIDAINGALSNTASGVSLFQAERGNSGTWYVEKGGSIPSFTIDSFDLNDVSLIVLDVEGHELEALQGGARTIEQCSPVIMLEEKQLPHMTRSCDEAQNWLADLGYEVYERAHRDLILCRS